MKFRILIVAVALLTSVSLFAQAHTSDAGIFAVSSALDDTKVTDAGDVINFDFSEKTEYGLSLNHYWTDDFSTELAYQKIKADLDLGLGGSITFHAGRLDAESITAMGQWHFLRASRFSPYVGAGLAHVTGDFKFNEAFLEPGDPGKVDLESNTTWTASAGANIRLTNNLSIGTEFKYIPWSPKEKDDAAGDEIDVNPLTFSAGLRLRF